MKDYIVSARKYRPMTFDTVVGQEALTTTLRNAIKSGRLAHAYLFCGPRGVGKTTCARIFAKSINCLNPTADGEACNECESCKAFNEQRSYNIFELDAASNNGVEHIKSLMEQTRIPPQIGKYKVFIIDEVHMLSTQAFNAFLKTLEEPPSYVIFILATTEKQKVLPTIISRCQIYDFDRMSVENIVNHLKHVAEKEGIQYEEEALDLIAEKADGGMRDALSIFDQVVSFCQGNLTREQVAANLNALDDTYYFKIVDLAFANEAAQIMVILNDIIAKGFDLGKTMTGLAAHIRNVLMAKDPQTISLLEVSESRKQKYREQAQNCPIIFLYKALKILNQFDVNYRQSSNKRLLTELSLIRIAQITQDENADDEGAGRKPKALKPIFNQSGAAAKHVAPAPQTEAPSVSQTDNHPSNDDPQVLTQVPKTVAQKPLATKMGKKGIGLSFNDLRGGTKKIETESVEPLVDDGAQADKKEAEKRGEFTQEDLQRQWIDLCNRMPKEMIGISSRMRNMKPRITEYPQVEVVAENEFLLKQMSAIKGRIQATLAQSLKNKEIKVVLRVAEASEVEKVKTTKDILEDLKKDYPAVDMLCTSLRLELS